VTLEDHIKRIEVIRPRGNAVVFDFAWDAAANQFNPIGTPDGYNARDASRLYILRDLTPRTTPISATPCSSPPASPKSSAGATGPSSPSTTPTA
jgi:hypothetical protein